MKNHELEIARLNEENIQLRSDIEIRLETESQLQETINEYEAELLEVLNENENVFVYVFNLKKKAKAKKKPPNAE